MSQMSPNFGLRGPKTPWVCPNDRQLALRAKLKTGWSVKTSQFNTYPKPQPLTETEQQMIISVVKKAEELDLCEQKRVGKLVDRLESLKSLASGNGVTDCILCGDSFGLSVFGKTNYKCTDCKKAVCRKCVVELSPPNLSATATKESVVRLCKICSENRELIKRSGAWFYKGVPKYILPDKKTHQNNFEPNPPSAALTTEENRYTSRYLNSHVINSGGSGTSGTSKRMGVLWSRSLIGKSQSECENDSSSGDEALTTTRKASSEKFHRRRLETDTKAKVLSPSSDKSLHNHHTKFLTPTSVELYEVSDMTNNDRYAGSVSLKQKSFDRFDPSGSIDQAVLSDNTVRSSGSSSNEGLMLSSATSLTSPSTSSVLHSPYGTLEVSILYDDTHQALHCTVHQAKDLTPMDDNGLSDPYCMLKLIPSRFQNTSNFTLQVGHHKTKTVHKSLQPVFNETVTFYGLAQSHLSWQTLQINVIDDDRWARDCLGFVQIPLHRIRPQQTRSFNLNLEKGRLITDEDKEWGRGSLLVSLSYLTEKSTLVVGFLRAKDLPALDQISGTSDPFVKVRLVQDSHLGTPSTSFHSKRKHKTGVKWKTLNPEFDEEFSFKVSIMDLPRLALAISVWDKDFGKHNDYIGGLVLSYGSKGERLKHWNDTIKLPNIKHTMWHSLSPTELPGH